MKRRSQPSSEDARGSSTTPPDRFFIAIDELINRHALDPDISATVSHRAVIESLVVTHGIPLGDTMDYLKRIEQLYGALGWDVHFERPGHDQPGEAVYTFTKRQESL